jgi:hypothetical protein
MLILASQERTRRTGQVVIGRQGAISAMDGACADHVYLVAPGSSENETCLDPARRWPERFRVMGIPGPNKPDRGRSVHSGSQVARREFGSIFRYFGTHPDYEVEGRLVLAGRPGRTNPHDDLDTRRLAGGQHDC